MDVVKTSAFPNIDAEIARAGLNKYSFAKAVDVSYSTIKSYMIGKTDIPCSKLVKMADLFGCITDYLLGLTDQPDNHQNVS